VKSTEPPTCRIRDRWLGFRWDSLLLLGKEASQQLTQFSFRLFYGQRATVLEDRRTGVRGDGLG
jgi:hypothetical protein